MFVSLTAYLKSLGDLSAIYQASYREPRALDHRVVQSGLNLYGGTTFLTGVLGTVPISAPWAVTVVYVSFTGVASKVVGIYLGLATLAIAPFSKLIAFLVVVPSPVLSAIYVIIFGALFVEGAKIAFGGQMDHKRGTVIGVSLVVGISAGSLAGQLEGSLGNIAGSVVASGSAVALVMTAITELTGIRRRKLEVDLALSSLTPIAEFLDGFAANRGWSEEARNRLHHVGEEVTLSLLEQGDEDEFSEGEGPEADSDCPGGRGFRRGGVRGIFTRHYRTEYRGPAGLHGQRFGTGGWRAVFDETAGSLRLRRSITGNTTG